MAGQNPTGSESLGLPAGGIQSYYDNLRMQLAAQANTTGLTQIGPSLTPQPPVARPPTTTTGGQSAQVFGPGQGAARQREAFSNLVKTSQSLANRINQYQDAKKMRAYELTIDRFTKANQGVQAAQAQIQQAAAKLRSNPNDTEAQQALKQGQDALRQNQAIINDMANDSKQHKIITKAFGVDDKNAGSPERRAAAKVIQDQSRPQTQSQFPSVNLPGAMGGGTQIPGGQGPTVSGPPTLGPQAANIMAQLPQTQQLSPQGQAQEMTRKAGITGAPATQGQLLTAETKVATTEATEAGKMARATAKDQLTAALNGQKYEGGKLVPMTTEEIAKNPILSSRMAVQEASANLKKAEADLANARRTAIPEQIKLAEGRLAMAQANVGLRQKEFGIRVEEESRKRFETEMKFGGSVDVKTIAGETQDISSITGGRPLESWAQKSIAETMPVFDQIDAIKSKIEDLGLKENDTAGYLFLPRLAYAAGFGGEEGKLPEMISSIEMSKVIGAARILKGSSRALPALQAAMIHLPDAWKGSPKQMYQQLENIENNLKSLNQEALTYGIKYQRSGEIEQRLQERGALPSKPATPAKSSAKPSGNLTYDPATGTVH